MPSTQISKAIPNAQISYAAASITATYTLAGYISDACIWANIVSTLDQPVQISFDGSVDHIAVPAGSTVPVSIPIDFKSNYSFLSAIAVYVKEIGNPTSGSLYISSFTAQLV